MPIVKSVAHGWGVWMSVGLFIIGLIPAITSHTIPRWVYWLLALISLTIGFCRAWNEEYDKAFLHQRELDEMYSDVVLDFLMQHHLKTFSTKNLSELMDWPPYRVERGLQLLEAEFPQLVQNDGALGWSFDLQKTIMRGVRCNLRRLELPKDSHHA